VQKDEQMVVEAFPQPDRVPFALRAWWLAPRDVSRTERCHRLRRSDLIRAGQSSVQARIPRRWSRRRLRSTLIANARRKPLRSSK
jgi:hypothetical protein